MFAIEQAFDRRGARLPIIVSGTITDASGRTLSGQTPEAFWNSVRHVKPLAVCLNCALGAALMRPYIKELSRVADTFVSCYPNAGLPNPMSDTGYNKTPDRNVGACFGEFERQRLSSTSVRRMVGGYNRPKQNFARIVGGPGFPGVAFPSGPWPHKKAGKPSPICP